MSVTVCLQFAQCEQDQTHAPNKLGHSDLLSVIQESRGAYTVLSS